SNARNPSINRAAVNSRRANNPGDNSRSTGSAVAVFRLGQRDAEDASHQPVDLLIAVQPFVAAVARHGPSPSLLDLGIVLARSDVGDQRLPHEVKVGLSGP